MIRTRRVSLIFAWFVALGLALLGRPAAAAETASIPWDLEALSKAPAIHPAPGFDAEGVTAIYFDGLSWHGRPTRVFAYYGLPAVEAGQKIPAMVLVHGGGGTAFAEWVRLWTSRGYAAIAPDTCGCTPGGKSGQRPRHELGGPPGWGGFDQIDQDIKDQWTYHAIADVILAHSLIRSIPEVDTERVGITGISWGGYLTCIAAGVDQRFKLAVPVYGCGFLGEDSVWLGDFQKMGKEKASKWLKLWDPSTYLASAKMPMLWVTGTNDFAYPMDSLQKSYRLPAGQRTLAIRIRMAHAHGGPGENPEEIRAFADSILKDGKPMAKITAQGRDGREVWVTYKTQVPLASAELAFTKDRGKWQGRNWQSTPARIDAQAGRVTASLPEGVSVYHLNLVDERKLVTSSEHEELPELAK